MSPNERGAGQEKFNKITITCNECGHENVYAYRPERYVKKQQQCRLGACSSDAGLSVRPVSPPLFKGNGQLVRVERYSEASGYIATKCPRCHRINRFFYRCSIAYEDCHSLRIT
jgi:RNase P subunit RPR2